jgi:hypothetical protein
MSPVAHEPVVDERRGGLADRGSLGGPDPVDPPGKDSDSHASHTGAQVWPAVPARDARALISET